MNDAQRRKHAKQAKEAKVRKARLGLLPQTPQPPDLPSSDVFPPVLGFTYEPDDVAPLPDAPPVQGGASKLVPIVALGALAWAAFQVYNAWRPAR